VPGCSSEGASRVAGLADGTRVRAINSRARERKGTGGAGKGGAFTLAATGIRARPTINSARILRFYFCPEIGPPNSQAEPPLNAALNRGHTDEAGLRPDGMRPARPRVPHSKEQILHGEHGLEPDKEGKKTDLTKTARIPQQGEENHGSFPATSIARFPERQRQTEREERSGGGSNEQAEFGGAHLRREHPPACGTTGRRRVPRKATRWVWEVGGMGADRSPPSPSSRA